MNIHVTGRHIQITPAIRDYATEKFERLQRHFDNIISVHIVFHIEKITHIAEATLHIPHSEIHAKAESGDLYSSIDLLIDKIDRQLSKHKEKESGHHD